MTKTARIWQRTSLTGVGLVLLALAGCCTTPPSDSEPAHSLPAAHAGEQVFVMPEQAIDALANANRKNDKTALLRILGPDSKTIISSGDAVADKNDRKAFVAAFDKMHRLDDGDQGQKILIVGEEEWPMPIPLVHVANGAIENGWQFDTDAGKQEILNRRVGHNEIYAIETARVYVEAQREYAAQHHAPNGLPEYAQKFISSKGKQDGLYWPVTADENESPFGPLIADAHAEGYNTGKKHGHNHGHPFHGYYFRILKSQSANAAGGAENYVVHGHMTEGFGLLAYPATYGDSGIMTFIVNQNGVVFQQNRGPTTTKYARLIKQYDPDPDWTVATLPPSP